MSRPRSKHPTELELKILHVLWKIGPANGRDVQAALAPARELAYTSVITVLNIMARKGYLRRRKVGGSFVFAPRVSEKATAGKMLRDLRDRVFHGSAGALMLRLLEDTNLEQDELAKLAALIDAAAPRNRKREE